MLRLYNLLFGIDDLLNNKIVMRKKRKTKDKKRDLNRSRSMWTHTTETNLWPER
jgi:hypothetical protein